MCETYASTLNVPERMIDECRINFSFSMGTAYTIQSAAASEWLNR